MINAFIESKAEKLLSDAGVSGPRVDIYTCAEFLKINVKPVQLDEDVSGFLAVNPDAVVIGYNQNHFPQRTRFTVAHEIGHFLLHKKDSRLFIEKEQKTLVDRIMYRDQLSSTGEYTKEREANAFAAALLMPKNLVKTCVSNSTNTENQDVLIAELALIFDVSKQAMQIRLTNLGIIDYDSSSHS